MGGADGGFLGGLGGPAAEVWTPARGRCNAGRGAPTAEGVAAVCRFSESLFSARIGGGRIGRYCRGWGEFMDPATLTALYAMLATFGLVVTDTYFNDNPMYLATTVAESVKAEGSEQAVVRSEERRGGKGGVRKSI